ncbi:MAG: PEP-utilizing enzyme, partial [Parcubacteria group bacterium]
RIEHENAFSRITYSSASLRAEAARRLRLSRDEYRRLKLEEVTAALRGEKLPLKKLSDSRSRHYVVVLGMQRCHVFAGKDADALMRQISYAKTPKKKRSKNSTRMITGICGSQGSAQGRVRIVSRIEDIGKLQQGEVLVTQNTTPTFLPAMKKSVAVITDEGGITCHAAIVSRELGIPCVIGTKNATQVLKNGQKVNVDATRGIVKRI